MKRLGNYLMLGLWLFASLWFIFGIGANILDVAITILLGVLLYGIIKYWKD